jgi:hypothetical protein
MTTAEDLIKAAYRWLGKKEPSEINVANGLEAFNSMLSNLSAKKVFIPQYTLESFPLVAGTASYTIGLGQTFNTVVPLYTVRANVRSAAGVDTPVDVITDEEYNRISIKTTSGTPDRLLYLYGKSSGTIYVYPVQSAVYTLCLESYKPLTRYAAKTDNLDFPFEYEEPLKFMLALRLTGEVNALNDERFAQVKSMAKEAKDDVVSLNMARTGVAPQRLAAESRLFR